MSLVRSNGQHITFFKITPGKIIKTPFKWRNKEVYVYEYEVTSLPNATSQNYTTGLPTNGIKCIYLSGLYGNCFPVNFNYVLSRDLDIGTYYYGGGQIQITTGSDRTGMGGFVDIWFVYD